MRRTLVGRRGRSGGACLRVPFDEFGQAGDLALQAVHLARHVVHGAVLLLDVLFEEGPVRRRLVDVDLLDLQVVLVQETPGVLAGGSGGFGVEGRLGHGKL